MRFSRVISLGLVLLPALAAADAQTDEILLRKAEKVLALAGKDPSAASRLSKLGPQAIPLIRKQIFGETNVSLHPFTEALIKLEDPEALTFFRAMTASKHLRIRLAGIRGLGLLRSQSDLELIASNLLSDYEPVQWDVLIAMQNLDCRQYRSQLREMMLLDPWEFYPGCGMSILISRGSLACKIVVGMGDTGVREVERLLDNKDEGLRARGAHVLAEAGLTSSRDKIYDYYLREADPKAKSVMREALAKLNDPRIFASLNNPVLLGYYKSEESAYRLAMMAKIGGDNFRDVLESLVRIGTPDAIEVVEFYLKGSHVESARIAAQALVRGGFVENVDKLGEVWAEGADLRYSACLLPRKHLQPLLDKLMASGARHAHFELVAVARQLDELWIVPYLDRIVLSHDADMADKAREVRDYVVLG